VIAAKPEKIYRAFLEPDALARWLPPNGFACKVHQMDPKVGDSYKIYSANFTAYKTMSFEGKYRELRT
jgi:uncharacterized protein YndB with AHSA1/START domain